MDRARLSPNGQYAALVLHQDLALTTASGKVVWRRPKTAVNRWLTEPGITAAASSDERLFAVTGGSGFKNVLLLDDQGREFLYLSTRGTPEALAFDPQGTRLAIGTSSGWLYVVSLKAAGRGSIQVPPAIPRPAVHTATLGGLLSELSFSPDGRFLVTKFSGVASLLDGSGKVLWKRSVEDYATTNASADWRWFTICEIPSHGPFYGKVSLVSRAGNALWSRDYRDPQAAVSPDNRYVLLRDTDPGDGPPAGPGTDEWTVLDWHGKELPRSGKAGRFQFRAPGGVTLSINGMTWTATHGGKVLWTTRTEFYKPDY